jgi:hypothetical protein
MASYCHIKCSCFDFFAILFKFYLGKIVLFLFLTWLNYLPILGSNKLELEAN